MEGRKEGVGERERGRKREGGRERGRERDRNLTYHSLTLWDSIL